MARIETTVAKGYGKHFGGKIAYLRELMANGIDGEARNKASGRGAFDANFSRNGTLTLANWGVKVSTSALLMGTSESREDTNCIGQFGEGLVMALKGLCELGHTVEIWNRTEKWRPAIEVSRSFDGAEVLVVHTRKCDDRGGFIVKVKGLEREDWTKLQGLFLSRHPEFDSKQTASDYYNHGQVLLQPEFRGKVYNKGVLLLEREDLLFGYNLHEEEAINRDRNVMSDYDLKAKVMDLLDDAACADEPFQTQLIEHLFHGDGELELKDTYSSLRYRGKICQQASEVFWNRYGQNATPVRTDEEVSQASQLGLRGVVVPATLWGILTGTSNFHSIGELQSAMEREVAEENPVVTTKAQDCLYQAEYLLEKGGYRTPRLRLVVFGGDEMEATRSDEEILVAKRVAEAGLAATIKAILSVRNWDDEPGSREVLIRNQETLCKAMEVMWGAE